ncbi:MAG TPA: hypothetical protein VGN97_06700 [Mesorhizobium sp.]|jgi:hypothetical protein|nr:hypothetical protein [Mesorhizobium sp.]
MFGSNRERHPPADLDGGRIKRLVMGALFAVALIALALFFGQDMFLVPGLDAGRTASIDTPHVQAPALTP